MKTRYLVLLTVVIALLPGSLAFSSNSGDAMTPDQALSKLKTGNARYVESNSIHRNISAARRKYATIYGQQPFATILGCSDSRSPIELIFNQGIGDIFVVRVAGNVCSTNEIASIEYGTQYLGTSLLVVLGHTKCGAVAAAVEDAKLGGSLPKLVDNIRPAVKRARKEHPDLKGPELVDDAAKSNVWQSIEDLLKSSSGTRELVKAGKLRIEGALYDLKTGEIEWMGAHPEQDKLLK